MRNPSNRWACFGALTLTVLTSAACGSSDTSSQQALPPVQLSPRQTNTPAPTDASPDASPAPAPVPANASERAAAITAPAVAFNPMTDTAQDALSTFALDVDTGSYTLARSYLNGGSLPDPGLVRTEEFVNSFDQDYPNPTDGQVFTVTVDATKAPFLPTDRRIVRVGVQGRQIDESQRKDANLTFVVDVSGSMSDAGKLDLIFPTLKTLLDNLRPTDRIAIVVYNDDTRIALPSTPVSERQTILDVIDNLRTDGSTYAEAGLRLGYDEAQRSFDSERINRVILLSDGVANVGETGADGILAAISDAAKNGIDLVTLGFGMGSVNDPLMEQLADNGNGFYAYIDGEAEAHRLFSEELTGSLQTIARDAKAQVEFNAATVLSYRLVGYENRAIADTDFRDDTVDAGEIGAGHTVTALYEIVVNEAGSANNDDWIARATLRWLDPDTKVPSEYSNELIASAITTSPAEANPRLAQNVYVASFAEALKGGEWGTLQSPAGLEQNVRALAGQLDDADLQELADLIQRWIDLKG